jgi:hypothetical protein
MNTVQETVRRAVANHSWASLEEWRRALDDLANMSDTEIEQLVATNTAK